MAQLAILPPYGTLRSGRCADSRDLLGWKIPSAGIEKLLGILLNSLNEDLKVQMCPR